MFIVPHLVRHTSAKPLARWLGAAVFALTSMGLGFGTLAPAQAQSDEVISDDNLAERSVDLERAGRNHGISPDRIVVLYDRQSSPTVDPDRLRVRQYVAGR